ncbi:MAG TPA: YetF domain-containing protein [Acidobacteriaceae bacterium]|nr:YetF domain-containing protein [Acidobacteriaceae bacterium]
MAAVLRAFFGYLFLVLVVRIVGRRPGKQLTPFEFVLVFFIGGLALTAIVGNEASFTNGICQIVTMGLAHYTLAWGRSKSSRFARLVDGTPLILLEKQNWRVNTLRRMRIKNDDVIASARDSGIGTLQEIGQAVLERNGEISISARAE